MRRTNTSSTEWEKKLTLALQHKAAHIAVPNELTTQVEHLFEKHVACIDEPTQQNLHTVSTSTSDRQRTVYRVMQRVKHHFRWRAAAVLLTMMIVLSGGAYASNMVYSIMSGQMMITLNSQTSHSITSEQTLQYRNMTTTILAQLQPGQRAYVYSNLLPQLGFDSVVILTKPNEYDSIAHLQQALQPTASGFPKPQYIPSQYQFAYGTDTSWIENNSLYGGESKIRLVRGLLQNKLTHPTANYAWMPVPPADAETITQPDLLPRLIYTSSNGHTLSMSFSKLDQVAHDTLDLNMPQQANTSIVPSSKGKMIYTSTDHSYMEGIAQSGWSTIQTLNWSEHSTKHDTSWLISLSSDDPALSQADMIRIAEQIQ
ncbi:hypothetical protein [Paenibacillus kandeliae]|uniref:hypothetical protein n=1 Tax=Paenibacillus kandeliae TaxID=3231269 RepID=UPI003458A9B2